MPFCACCVVCVCVMACVCMCVCGAVCVCVMACVCVSVCVALCLCDEKRWGCVVKPCEVCGMPHRFCLKQGQFPDTFIWLPTFSCMALGTCDDFLPLFVCCLEPPTPTCAHDSLSGSFVGAVVEMARITFRHIHGPCPLSAGSLFSVSSLYFLHIVHPQPASGCDGESAYAPPATCALVVCLPLTLILRHLCLFVSAQY